MALPTATDILTMNFTHMGEPFVNVAAKEAVDTWTIDYTFFGEPFVTNHTPGTGGTALTLDLSDSVNLSMGIVKDVSTTRVDTTNVSDTFSRVVNFNRTITDTVNLTDNLSKAVAFLRTFIDSVTLGDSISKSVDKVASDDVILSETRTVEFNKLNSDTANVSDSRAMSVGKLLEDNIEISTTGYIDSQNKFPTLVDSDGTGSLKWEDHSNVLDHDEKFAYVIASEVGSSEHLIVSNFGFNVPSNATILGIEVNIEKYSSDCTTSSGTQDSVVSLYIRGEKVGDQNKAKTRGYWEAKSFVTIYGSSDDLWNTDFEYEYINDPTFGVGISVKIVIDSEPTIIAYVNYISITIYYSVPITEVVKDVTKVITDNLVLSDTVIKDLGILLESDMIISEEISKSINKNVGDIVEFTDNLVKSFGLTITDTVELQEYLTKFLAVVHSDGIILTDYQTGLLIAGILKRWTGVEWLNVDLNNFIAAWSNSKLMKWDGIKWTQIYTLD